MSNERLNFDKNLETLQKLNFQLLYASTSKYEGDWQSLPHTHHFTELFYVISGLGKFLVEDRLITVKEMIWSSSIPMWNTRRSLWIPNH